MRLLRAFGRFWYDFIVGDDWRIALGVTVVLAAGALLVASSDVSDSIVEALVALGIVTVVSASIVAGTRR